MHPIKSTITTGQNLVSPSLFAGLRKKGFWGQEVDTSLILFALWCRSLLWNGTQCSGSWKHSGSQEALGQGSGQKGSEDGSDRWMVSPPAGTSFPGSCWTFNDLPDMWNHPHNPLTVNVPRARARRWSGSHRPVGWGLCHRPREDGVPAGTAWLRLAAL